LQAAAVVALAFGAGGSPAAAAERDCAAIAKQVSRDIAAKPERVLIIVEDALVVNEACACEVVKAAIVAASASAKLAGQIVLIAVTAAPSKASLIADCAKAASPDASGEIDAAVRQAVGSETAPPSPATSGEPVPSGDAKNPAASKNPSTPAPATEETADFGLSPVAIGGVYLVYPGGSGSPQLSRDADGNLYYVGPDGKRVLLDPPAPPKGRRPSRPPAVIIITPPTPTTSDDTPQDPTPEDPIPQDPIPEEPTPQDPPPQA